MLVPATGRTLEQELEDSILKFFSGYSPSIELGFRCGDVAGTLGLENRTDRLEAEPSTQYVDVPLSRTGAVAGQSRSTLVVEWPDGIRPVTSNIVNWAALETNAYVSVDLTLPGGASFPEGKRLELTLLDASGQVVATNGITFVASKPNACTNPYWVGERTVDTLGFAEWTHDYDLVRAKVAAGRADYTLAVFSGTLWCPYCHGMEESLLKSDAFKAWCAANRVQVALFDQSQTAANGGGSQLLTYAPGTEHIANTDAVTGASYLSRHSLRDDDPDAVRIRATTPLSSYVAEKGQKVTIKVTSGKLPKGVSLKWDAATSSVVLNGTPTKTGTYSFTYQVVVKTANGKTVSSEKTKATVTVASAASINPHYGKAIVASVPLYKTDTWGVKTVASVVQVAQTTARKLSVKRFAGATTSLSGTWKKVDPESGILTASLKKGSVTVVLTLTPEGLLTASIAGNAGTVSVVNDYARFAGRYTVTLPVDETTAYYYTFGTGYLTLKTSTLTSLKGLVTYAGALPNGVAVSGSAYLGSDPEDPDYVFLPIFKQSSRTLVSSGNGKKKYATKDDLAAVLRIRANGEAYYTDDEQNRIVLAPEGVSATWKRTTTAPGNALVATLSVYGGYYVPGGTLDSWLELFGLGTESDLVATVDGLDVQAIWKFSPETGVLTGTAKTVVNRRTVTASFKGVILPGWLDCGCGDDLVTRPFASGTFYWSEFVNGITTPASLEFNLNAP